MGNSNGWGGGSMLDGSTLKLIKSRLHRLESEYSCIGGPLRDVSLERLCKAARVQVEWQSGGAWRRAQHGAGLVTSSRAGFTVRLPLQHSIHWNRFVIAHEVGHTLFFRGEELLSEEASLSTKSAAKMYPLPRDIWVGESIEEDLCDEIADALLVPRECVNAAVEDSPDRLHQVLAIADSCLVPIDRALRRLVSAGPAAVAASWAKCMQIAMWKIPGLERCLNPTDRVTLLYTEGCWTLRPGTYLAGQVGLAGVSSHDARRSGTLSGMRVPLVHRRQPFDVEFLWQKNHGRHLVVVYDATAGGASPFGSTRLLSA
jgi:hypothetical protein